MSSNVWDEISYQFPNFNGATVEVWEWINHPTLDNGCDYLSMQGLKVTHVHKTNHRKQLHAGQATARSQGIAIGIRMQQSRDKQSLGMESS